MASEVIKIDRTKWLEAAKDHEQKAARIRTMLAEIDSFPELVTFADESRSPGRPRKENPVVDLIRSHFAGRNGEEISTRDIEAALGSNPLFERWQLMPAIRSLIESHAIREVVKAYGKRPGVYKLMKLFKPEDDVQES